VSHLRTRVLAALLSGLLWIMAGSAAGQTFPSRPVHIIVPFPPGGGTDTLIRLLAPRLSKQWGQPVIIENKPGASGQIGSAAVAQAVPDGHTLLMASTAAITGKNIRQFAPVALVSAEPYVVTLHPAVPAENVRELIAYVKANPGKLSFGSSGIGAASHLSGELFKSMAGIDIMHVPYKGTGQALVDLLAGHIGVMFAPAQTVLTQLQSGKLKAIAVTGSKPLEALPKLPTVAASGLPNYQAVGWFGLLAPVATPKDIVAKLHADVNRVLALPEVRKEMAERGGEPGSGSAEEFGRFISADQIKWSKLMQDAGIVIE
jgi:tripartite-type tricarboxylate transporter receptor subunit TctC